MFEVDVKNVKEEEQKEQEEEQDQLRFGVLMCKFTVNPLKKGYYLFKLS